MRRQSCQRQRARLTKVGLIRAIVQPVLTITGLLHSYFPCRNCKRLVGPGCNCHARGALERGVPNLPVRLASEKDLNVSWCCDSGRLFLIWSLLCGTQYEKPSVRANLKPSSSEGKVQPEDKDTAKNAKSPETKSSKLSKGTGYAGDKKEITFKAAAKIRKELASENMYLQKYFAALSVIYPSIQVNRKRPTAFDRRPPDMITECVERSPLLRKACEVLRNESVQEIGAQTGLYTAVLEFVECLGAHVSGRPLVYGEHHLFSLPEQLLHFTLTPAPNTTSKASEQAEMSQSLHASLCQLAQNCRSFLQIASGHRDVFEDGADRQLLALCKDIIVLFEAQAQARADMQARCPPKASMDRATEDYKEWHSNNCLNDVPDDKVIQSFHTDLRVEAEKLLNSKPASGRMKRIITQISDLRTGLPEGIYVRHGTSRPDVIKVLMVGTRDTPYENGLFEFDMLCDEHFPTRPPAMRFRTTGGGVVRFNPNLYQNGTVCLSLLNTWGGQRWVQDYTTMLTLLVSIHGMVFNDEPYYNEPGYEQQINKAASEAYNKSTQELTVQHALLHWLLDRLCPPFKTPSAAAKTQATPPQSATFQTVPASFTHPPHTASHPQAQSQYASAKNENKQPAAPAPFLPAPQPFTPSSYPSFHQTFNPVQPHAHIVGSHGLQLAGYLPTAYAFHPHMGPHPSHPGSHLAPVFAPGSGGAPPFGPHNMPVPVAVHNTVPQPGQIGYPVSYAFPMGSPSWVVNQQALGGQQPPYPPPPPAALPQQTVEQGRRPVTDPRDGDDGVWGDVIRKHFATRGRDILATARKWEKTWSANKNTKTDPKAPTLVDSLETALRLHGFIH
ncbi:hypothetical protein QBC46DRAFT_111102 [Diplogelasinospora grovesii]|uniref:UBC core domain-containing protein n=1 Tax=Diplogelasinospora grovesii TaxID=303347 RepID=A0AAN6N9P5_9PEZI|nr:hypothetical protein QBC46DRAFT_111102 [Diplogelasinospora grovesii]